jgi:hypothetical protein
MLYYKDTKLKKKGKGVTRTNINKYIGAAAKALAVGEPIAG